jgi:hypothetical protein
MESSNNVASCTSSFFSYNMPQVRIHPTHSHPICPPPLSPTEPHGGMDVVQLIWERKEGRKEE